MDLIKLHGAPRHKWRQIDAEEKYRPKYPHYKAGDPCARCGELMDDDSEYVNVGVGMAQVTYFMNCYGCGLTAGNSGTDVIYMEWNEEGEAIEWIDPREVAELP